MQGLCGMGWQRHSWLTAAAVESCGLMSPHPTPGHSASSFRQRQLAVKCGAAACADQHMTLLRKAHDQFLAVLHNCGVLANAASAACHARVPAVTHTGSA